MSRSRQNHLGRRATAVIAVIAVMMVLLGGCTDGLATSGKASHAASRPPAPQPSVARDFTAFAGQWGGHERGLTIRASGSFSLTARTYREYDQDPPPCDVGTEPGDVATGVVTHTTDETGTPLVPASAWRGCQGQAGGAGGRSRSCAGGRRGREVSTSRGAAGSGPRAPGW